MEIYFIKSAACLAVLLLFYKLLLEKENMHIIKRAYLLLAVVASIVIPLITFTTYIEPVSGNFEPVFLNSSEEITSEPVGFAEYLPFILWSVYFTGVLFFSLKFIRNLKDLVGRIRKNPQIKRNRFTNVLLSEKVSPHTFFSYIFLNKTKYERQEIPREVLVHEEAHALQKHSFDILLVELFQIIFWLNPFILLLKKAVKLNHEFLADRAVILQGVSTPEYQQTLLSFSSGDLHSDLVNPINYSSIKKRFTVMKTRTTKKTIWVRSLLFLPVLAGLLYGFSTKKVVERETENSNFAIENSEILELKMDEAGKIYQNNKVISLAEVKNLNWKNYTNYAISISPDVLKIIEKEFVALVVNQGIGGTITVCAVNNEESANSQEKATPEMVAEYNKIAKHYNSISSEEGSPVKKKDYERMKYIYNLMTAEQKKKSESFPVLSPPPPPNDNMVAEYNRLVKYYNELPEDKRIIKQEDLNRIMFIHSIMSPEQKESAEKIIFKVPPPPPPAPAPTPKTGQSAVNIPVTPPIPPVPAPVTGEGGNKVSTPPLPEIPGVYPPPPPAPPTFEGLVEKGATFYYKGKIITPEEALNLVSIEKKVNVQVTDNDTEPVVKLTDKEIE